MAIPFGAWIIGRSRLRAVAKADVRVASGRVARDWRGLANAGNRVAPWGDFHIENGRPAFNKTTPKELVMSSHRVSTRSCERYDIHLVG